VARRRFLRPGFGSGY